MIVECGNCSTKFKIADEKVTPTGVKVRCSKCKNTFLVNKGGTVQLVAAPPAPAAAPSAPAVAPPPPGKMGGVPSLQDGIPDDIFSAPTKVGPSPPRPDDAAPGKFPVPPPAMPMPAAAGGGPSLADQVDLDADGPVTDAPQPATPLSPPPSPSRAEKKPESSPPPPPIPPAKPPSLPAKPPSNGEKKSLGDDLFGDLSDVGPAPKPDSKPPPVPLPPPSVVTGPKPPAAAPSAPPAQPAPVTTPASPQAPPASPPKAGSAIQLDDSFAGLDGDSPLSARPPAPASPPPAPASPPPAPASPPPAVAAPSPSPASPAPPVKPAPADDPFADLDLSDPIKPSPEKPPGPAMGDDPFAGIDLSGPPAPPTVPPPAAVEPPPGKPAAEHGQSSSDLFDDLGDPFAGLGTGPSPAPGAPPPAMPPDPEAPQDGDPWMTPQPPNASELPPELAPVPPAGGDDPFSAIEASVGGAPSADIGGELTGNDPFGALDRQDPTVAEGEMASGLELDEDGQLTGQPMPAPPPPSRTFETSAADLPGESGPAADPGAHMPMAAGPQAGAVGIPAPLVEAPPSTGKLLLYKLGTGVLVLVVALLFFVSWRNDFKPDFTSWDTYVVAFTGRSGAEEVPGDLEAVKVSNTSYANRLGHPLVVLWGEVRNTTQEKKAALVVTGKMMSRKGDLLGEFAAPAGITFTPDEVYAMTDVEAVPAAYHARLPKVADLAVGPGEAVPFMLVFYDHPEEMDGIHFRILPNTSADPLRGLPKPAEPAEADDAEEVDEDSEAPDGNGQPARPGKGEGGKPKKTVKPSPTQPGVPGIVVKKTGTHVKFKKDASSPEP